MDKKDKNREKQTETVRIRQKRTEAKRNGQKQIETDTNRQLAGERKKSFETLNAASVAIQVPGGLVIWLQEV